MIIITIVQIIITMQKQITTIIITITTITTITIIIRAILK